MTKPRVPNPGAFKKGISGNPGGLKKGKKLREQFEPYVPDAVAKVVALLNHENPAHQLRASEIIFERTNGKPLAASEVLLRDERESAVVAKAALTPEEVKAGVADVLARAAGELGIAAGGLSQDELARQLKAARDAGEPEPPSLYEATMPGTRH
jgi:hypothetical protein